MNRISVFEWHKRSKEGRESVSDDERCGRNKEVRTPELIGQIKNVMDENRRVSLEAISAQFDASVGTVHTIIIEELKMRKIFARFVPRVHREDQKERRCRDSREMVELINSDPAVLVTCNESWIYCYDPDPRDTVPSGSMLALPDTRKPDRANPQSNFWWSFFFWQHWHDLHALGSHWTESQRGLLCWGFKGDQEEIPSDEARILQIESWHFHQDNAPVPKSILVTDYLTKFGMKTVPHPPYSPDLAPCEFWLFPKLKKKLRGCRFETTEEMKEAVTKVFDTLTQEDIHGAYQKLLKRYKCIAAGGDYFEGD